MKPIIAILIAALLAGCAPSSYQASLYLREKFPNCDITEARGYIGEARFYIRTQDGRILFIRMTSTSSILLERVIFEAPAAMRGVEQ